MAENIPPTSSTAVAASSGATAIANPAGGGTATTTSGTSTSRTADQPGRPYYESLRTTLRATIEKKRRLDEQIAALEDQLFKSEATYLEETVGSGNIVRGFDAWVKGVQVSARMGAPASGVGDERRRGGVGVGAGGGGGAGGRVREEDRVFSRSSVGWLKLQDGSSDSATPSTAPTPSATTGPALNGGGRDGQTPTSGTATTKSSNNKKKRPAASASSATATTTAATGNAGSGGVKEKKESGDDDDAEGNTKGVKRGKITYARD